MGCSSWRWCRRPHSQDSEFLPSFTVNSSRASARALAKISSRDSTILRVETSSHHSLSGSSRRFSITANQREPTFGCRVGGSSSHKLSSKTFANTALKEAEAAEYWTTYTYQ